MGKLDYLSKYTNSASEKTKKCKKDSKKKKKKKSSSKSSSNKGSGGGGGGGDEILVRDEDDDFLAMRQASDDDDGDRPTVVEDFGSSTGGFGQCDGDGDIVALRRLPHAAASSIDNKERSRDEKGNERPSRKRYDSDDDSAPRPIRRRYDSDDDESPTNKSSKRRRTGDSDDDAGRHKPAVKRRYDSDDEADRNKPSIKREYDSDDDEVLVRIKRSDSDAEEPTSRRRRYDSDSDPQHHDSGTKRVKTNSSDDEQDKRRQRMSSGHVAGLQQAGDFRGAEQEIQRKRRKDAQAMVDKHGMGDTVYRDELGRKVDEIPTATTKKSVPQLNEKDQAALNKGRVQKNEDERLQKQFRELQQSSFARSCDDAGLENIRKDAIREGDPMAAYAMKKKAKVRAASGLPVKSVYKGPAPKPNRFGIRPGYRWDGVDRGNGFEDKALGSKYSTNRKKEEAHRWSTSDM